MKTKRILRFYFAADSLDRAFDNLIMRKACTANADGFTTAESICDVIAQKSCLERLWSYLDSVLTGFSQEDRVTLLNYSARCAPKNCGNEVKRVVIRFVRHARRLPEFAEDIAVLDKYAALMA